MLKCVRPILKFFVIFLLRFTSLVKCVAEIVVTLPLQGWVLRQQGLAE